MSEWLALRLGEVGQIYDGPHATPRRLEVGPYFLNIASLNNGRLDLRQSDHVSAEDFSKWTRRVTPRAGDLLFSYETRLGEAAIMPAGVEACLGRRMALIRPKRDVIVPEFLLFLYLAPRFQSTIKQNTIHGATVNRIPLNQMASWEVLLPPLSQQQAIAEVLGALDDKIAANTALAERLVAYTNALFFQRFGERPLDTQLGTLAEVVDCLHSKKPERSDEGQLLMQLNNIRDDGLVDTVPEYRVSEVDYARWSKKFETRPWDLVITNVGRIGAVARVPNGYKVAIGRNMTGLRPRDVTESGSFLAAALHSSAVRCEIEQRTDAGSVMSALNVRSIPLLRLPFSTADERRSFHEIASSIFQSADVALSENRTLAATRDALLPQLMSGKLRVRDAEAAASAAGV